MSYFNDSNYFVNLINLMARQPKRNHRDLYNFKLSLCLSMHLVHLEWLACNVNANTERRKQSFRRSMFTTGMKGVSVPYSEKKKHRNDFDK